VERKDILDLNVGQSTPKLEMTLLPNGNPDGTLEEFHRRISDQDVIDKTKGIVARMPQLRLQVSSGRIQYQFPIVR
jgi:hypothetical protein